MIRTQVSLTTAQKTRLDRLAAQRGSSISELVRRAIDAAYPTGRDLDDDMAAISEATGAWQDRKDDGEAYVERLRSGRRLSDA